MAQRSASVAPAPAPRPAAAAPAPAPAAGTSQAGGAAVALQGEVAPGVLDLKAMGDAFKPPEPLAAFLATHPRAQVQARLGNLAQGTIEVQTRGKGRYRVQRQRLPLSHPLFARLGEAAPDLAPCLVLDVEGEKISGHVGLAAGARLDRFDSQVAKLPGILGLAGFRLPSLSGVVNTLEAGRLKIGLKEVPITLGQAFSGKLTLTAEDAAISFDASATVSARGLANGTLQLKRAADGLITGRAAVALQLPKNFSGSLDVSWDGRAVNGEGKVGYRGEKLSGEVTLRLMERGAAAALEQQKKAPPEQAAAPAAAAKAAAAQKVDYVVFGEGDLAFAFTTWLNGTAHVIVDPKGYVTIIGKITPQREFELFPQKDYVRQIFKIEVRASYGIPVVGNIFIFANVGMDAFAKIGPGKFYKIVAQGTYSTDPAKCQDFSIQGTFNISAAAGARLRGEAGAGLEILGHDIKAGAGVNGIAGIKGYAEATPIIGYREKAAPGEDKKGEWFIRGDMEIVAQPFLGLSGDLFVEVDAPWWSPVPDKKWTWPLGGKEWPLGGPLGIGATIDYVFGSGQWPKLDFKPVEFSADKFMTDLYSDKAKSGKGGEVEKPGQWKEKNSASASAPPKASPKGNAAPGKAAAPAPAKAKVQPGGGRKGGKEADPNARTAGGKTVRQLQDEAVKKGKKVPGGEGKGAPKGGEAGKPATDITALLKSEKAEFQAEDNSRHKVFLDPAAADGKVVVESKRTYLSDLISQIPKTKIAQKKDAERRQKKIVELIKEGKKAKTPESAKEVAKEMQAQLDGIAKDLADAGIKKADVLPAPTYSYGSEAAAGAGGPSTRATKASVTNLSAARQRGSVPGSSEPAGWTYAQAIGKTTSGPAFRRLHLINDRFGGPGMIQNLAVAGKTDNENHLYKVENEVKKIVGDVPNEKDTVGVVNKYEVKAIYGRPKRKLVSKGAKPGVAANLNDFPSAFECTLRYHEHGKPNDVKAPKLPTITFGDWEQDLKDGSN